MKTPVIFPVLLGAFLGLAAVSADELTELEAAFAKKLGTVQRPIAEAYVTNLTRLEAAYRQSGHTSEASQIAKEIKFINSQLAADGPISLNAGRPVIERRNLLDQTGMTREDLPTSVPLDLSRASRTGTVEYEEATGKLTGWRSGSAQWDRTIRLAAGTYEVIFEFACPPAGGGTISIEVPGTDLPVIMGQGELSTETWADVKSAAVGTFQVEQRWAGKAFDFGIEVTSNTGTEIMQLSSLLLRKKEGE